MLSFYLFNYLNKREKEKEKITMFHIVFENHKSFEVEKYCIFQNTAMEVTRKPKLIQENMNFLYSPFFTSLMISRDQNLHSHLLFMYENLIAIEFDHVVKDESNGVEGTRTRVWSIGFLRKGEYWCSLLAFPIVVFENMCFDAKTWVLKEILIPPNITYHMIWLPSFKMNYIRQRMICHIFGFGRGWSQKKLQAICFSSSSLSSLASSTKEKMELPWILRTRTKISNKREKKRLIELKEGLNASKCFLLHL